jgi:hypothetical protein
MPKTTLELKEIARLGGGLSIDAATKTTLELKEILRLLNASNSTFIIRNADLKTALELKEISRIAPGKVIFEI